MIKANRKGEALDLASSAYSLPIQRKRFLDVVQEEVRSSIQAKEEGTMRKEVVVEVPIPRESYNRLKLLIYDRNAGRKKISISDYVSRVVQNHIRKFSS